MTDQDVALEALRNCRNGKRLLKAKVAEYDALFALQFTRMGEATTAWRAAHPGNELVQPDLGALLTWLLGRIKELEGPSPAHALLVINSPITKAIVDRADALALRVTELERVPVTATTPQTYEVIGSLYEHACAYGCDSKWAVNCNCAGLCKKHPKAER